MTAVLLASAASTLFMVGLAWFVQVVHYPLFPLVGETGFPAFHDLHSRRTSFVVIVPMAIELVSSVALAMERPDGVGLLGILGAVLAGFFINFKILSLRLLVRRAAEKAVLQMSQVCFHLPLA